MDIVAILFFVVVVASLGVIFDAPWVPTEKKDYDRIIQFADLKSGQIFWDIGSGSGNLLFYAARKYNLRCVGIEISPFWYAFSKAKSLFYKNVDIKFGDFYDFGFGDADAVYTFLTQPKYKKVKEKFDGEAKQSAKLIFAVWPVPNQAPDAEDLKAKSKPYYKYVKS